MSKSLVWDYGQVARAQERPDGSIVAYGRLAVANQPYIYVNGDGSIRKEAIRREDLFDRASTATLKIMPVTLEHPPEQVTPGNYKKYAVGSTGNLIVAGLDGDYLGVIQAIQDAEAIAAYKAGKRQLSPGYNRNVREGALSDGVDFWQFGREYNHDALVDYARGGLECALKDSVFDGWIFDSSQIDESLISYWQNTEGLQIDAIDRLLNFGTLSPPPINLDQPMTLVPITIGDKVLQVDAASADTASQLAASYTTISDKAAKSAELLDGLAKAEAANAVLTQQVKKLTDEAATVKDSAGDQITKAVKAIEDAKQEMKLFAENNVNIADAKLALDSYDLQKYRHAIVKELAKSNFDASEVDVRYRTLADAFGHGLPRLMMPQTSDLAMSMAANSGSIESAKAGTSNGYQNGLPSDADWE